MSAPTHQPEPTAVTPTEGWHVLHLFYQINHTLWDITPSSQREAAKQKCAATIAEIRATPGVQLLSFSILTPKADIGYMLLTADLHLANRIEKRLTQSLGPGILRPVYHYLSITEWTEYVTSDEEQSAKITAEKGFLAGSPEHTAEMETFHGYLKKYRQDRLYPNMPDWPVYCFYPMNKCRRDQNNWYSLPFPDRRRLMSGHAVTGRRYHGKVRQLITGSTGLDTHEWGVTLFAHTTSDIKSIVYDMRFDEVSAKYGEFGDFYIGLQLPIAEIHTRLGL